MQPESSTGVEAEVGQTTEASAHQDVTSESSTGTEIQGEKSMLDAVKTALDGPEKSPPSETGETPAAAEKPAEPSDPLEIPPEELAKYTPNAQARIKELVAARREAESQVAQYKTEAESFRSLKEEISRRQIAPNDLDAAIDVLTNFRENPRKALESLLPVVQVLQQMTGEQLPSDLAEEVRLGYVTEARARELARLRADTSFQSQRTEQEAREREAQAEQAAWQRRVETARSAVNAWEESQRKVDPDWNLKSSRLMELLELDLRRGNMPESGAQAVEMAKAALKKVETEFRQLRPKAQPVSSMVTAASTRSTAQPKTMLEAIKLAAAGG